MHEWALAESIIVTIMKEYEKEKLSKVFKVTVKIGELQSIELDIFNFALENMIELYKPPVDLNNICLEIDRCILKCKVCDNHWNYRDTPKKLEEDEKEAIHFIPEVAHTYMRCTQCGSPDFEILQGRGVWIDSIEGEK
ncbi:MAG: hydrogenase nickel incorporation protein HypA [Desulfotomaculaceae bacterium]|nr:hydrogenase nickel incorporation protein HypA [Desulfotomaculaceae bacterium]